MYCMREVMKLLVGSVSIAVDSTYMLDCFMQARSTEASPR